MMKKAFSSDLMARIKMIKGENFVTVENTKNLTDQELIQLLPYLMRKSSVKTCKNVNILVDSQCSKEVVSLLKEYEFMLHDENVTVHKALNQSSNMQGGFKLKDLHDLSTAEFKKVWEASMEGSLNCIWQVKNV
ncbi:hypothetical protein [Rossellomorea vietnamensis]|uniref:hypothetical protein n=1 Tax=Rossellomorea vietnamensis TaxID=218284 RepID=UPI00077C9286|nr:hypothetical protein [Rossellomorea vietnamensis]